MNILIAGATGFIGSELVKRLRPSHQITVLGRSERHLQARFPNPIKTITWEALPELNATNYDLIINLSGANIGEKRWTEAVKTQLIVSRVRSNERLIAWLDNYNATPRIMCANAVGIYGLQEENGPPLDENSPIDFQDKKDFLQEIGIAWQHSLQPAIDKGLEVTTLRFGVVLKKGQGMLKKLQLPYSLGLGHTLGQGKQSLSWIHYADAINAILFLIDNPAEIGAFNITSPNPVKQHYFAATFSNLLQRPLWLKMPELVIKILFGEMGECLLLKGQNVVPKRLLSLGFRFQYPRLNDALTAEYRPAKSSK